MSKSTKRGVFDRLRSNCRSGERKIPNRPEPNPQSSTLKDKSVLPTNQKTIIASGVAERFSSSEFQPVVHELLNELTIMKLCCSRFVISPNGLRSLDFGKA